MSVIERALRVMTHINVGASFGVAAWLLFGSIDLVTAQPATRHHAAPDHTPVARSTCDCAVDMALAEAAR